MSANNRSRKKGCSSNSVTAIAVFTNIVVPDVAVAKSQHLMHSPSVELLMIRTRKFLSAIFLETIFQNLWTQAEQDSK